MHLWNPPISLWIKYCFVEAGYLVNKDLNFETASLLNTQLQANPRPPSTLPPNSYCYLRNSKEKNTIFWRRELGALNVFHVLPSKLWILRHQIDSQLSANNFVISYLTGWFFFFLSIQKSHHISSNSWITAQIWPKNTTTILEFLVYLHSADGHRYSINIYWGDTIHKSENSNTPKL